MSALTARSHSAHTFQRDALPDPDECLACFWLRQISAHREHEVLCIDHLRAHVAHQRPLKRRARDWYAEHRSQLEQVGILAICAVLLIGAWLIPLGPLVRLAR